MDGVSGTAAKETILGVREERETSTEERVETGAEEEEEEEEEGTTATECLSLSG